MQGIFRELKEQTRATIAVCSLPNIGEDLNSPENELLRSYNMLLAEIAAREQVVYIPVNERQSDYLRNHQPDGGRRLEVDNFTALTLKFLLFHKIFRFSLDRIARWNRFLLTVEGIHMNRQGASIIADEIARFLRGEDKAQSIGDRASL